MGLMSKITGFLGGSLVKDIGEVADKFIQTPDEKAKFMLEVENTLQRRESEIEQTIRSELAAKSSVIIEELKQDDLYTKRARPSIIYMFLFFVFFNYCLVPLIQLWSNVPIKSFPVPEELWYLFGTVLSTYSLGRSVEKTGFRNKITSAITGSETTKESRVLNRLLN